MFWLKQSTAVTVPFGPFVLNTDGVTLVTNLVGTGSNQTENTTTGIRLSKNGGAQAARHATAGTSTYDAFGEYLVPLDTTDTNTLGTLRMTFTNGAAFCPVWADYMVIPAPMWNSLFGTGGSIPDAAANAAGGLLITAAGSLDMDEMNVDIEAIQASTAGLTFTAAGKVDSNALAINGVSTSPVTTMKAVQGLAVDGVVPTVSAVTGLTASNLDTTISSRASATQATNIQSDTDDIQTRIPAALVGGRMDSSVGAMAANTLTASALAADAVTEIQATILSDATPFPGADIDATMSSRAAASTALSTAQWTNTRAGYIDNLNALKIKKNTALAKFPFLMVLSVDHVTPATGLTVVVQRSIDGAAFGNSTNTPATEISAGVYYIDLSASDLNGNTITLKMTAATADQRTIILATEP